MSKNWIISDTHWSHSNITGPTVSRWKDGYRIFDSTHYMNQVLHETLNKYVGEDDVLYHVGDFAFGGEQNIAIHRNLINCKTIHLILGNHDKNVRKHPECFTTIQEELRIELEGYKIWFRHHPEPGYKGDRSGIYHIFGHIHSNIEQMPGGKSGDAGVDNAYRLFGEYRPFELNEFIELIDSGKINE
jgi:calcineurin-like phosphoesterase family protein